MRTVIISVGNEVTSGHTVNTNAAWLAEAIEPLGLTPERIITLRDDVKTLTAEIRRAARDFGLVIVTGGLGPTSDDVTKPALVRAFKTRLVRDEKSLRDVKRFFKKIDRPMAPVNEGQADVPEGFSAICNRFGTAPGLFCDTGSCLLFALPGVPYEMKGIMETEILAILKKRAPGGVIARRTLRTMGAGESSLYTMIEEAGGVDNDVELAYLPHFGQVDLRLTAHGQNTKEAKARLNRAAQKLRRAVGPYVFGEGDQTLEEVVGKLLARKKLTLAAAESCTGGLFSSRITSASGSSRYFLEGVVAYSNEAKERILGVKKRTLIKHGAVSAAVAAEMAEGARRKSGADIAVSSTGVAGPTGGTREKPVGLIYIAISSKDGTATKELRLGKDRLRNQDRTVKEMMEWLWKTAKGL